MLKRLAVIALLFAGCEGSCPGWDPTPKAKVRLQAEGMLKSCYAMKMNCFQADAECYSEVRAFCLDAGLERTCGEGYQGAKPCSP